MKNPTDMELDAAFSEKVAGWMQCERLGRMVWYDPSGGHEINPPRFTESADLVLPWLEKCVGVTIFHETLWGQPEWRVDCSKTEAECDYPEWSTNNACAHESFPRAAVIALLRANGVEVEFTS